MGKINILSILAVAAAMIFSSAQAHAQMSDDAVVAYVKQGMASGKSQNEMIKELAIRGVTREQIERLKLKNEKEKSNKTSGDNVSETNDRQRRINDGMFDSEVKNLYDLMSNETGDKILDNDQKKIFGHNIFSTLDLTFAPNSNIPTPVNYRLGPGDEVIIDIWGNNQATIRQTISPDGTINISDIGIVNLNGMTVMEAESYMRRKLGQIYSVVGDDAKSEIKLSLGNIRTVQVNLMGEVANPGTYHLSSLSNLYHALYRAGGVSELGSLRDIQLIRNGKKIEAVDVYDFIFEGKMGDNLILEDGDIIIVPTYKHLVDIAGNVKRPMLYEMADGETVGRLLKYAGGFTGDAYKENLSVIRRNGKEYQLYTVGVPEYDSFILMDGDSLVVGAVLDRYQNKLEIKGAVYRPGIYQLGNGVETVSQLIAKADGLKGDAFTNRVLLHREHDDLTLEVIPIDIRALLNGEVEDIALRKNDILYIPSIYELNEVGYISVYGEVASPGQFVYAKNTTIEDIIIQAGGLLESATTVRIEINRRVRNPKSTQQSEVIGQVYTFAFKDGYVLDGEVGFMLEPYDEVYVRKSPGYVAQTSVIISGEVIFPGKYVMTHKEERLSDLVKKAGGINDWAYVKGARLIRKMNKEEKARAAATMEVFESAKDTIDVEKLDMSEYYAVGIDLEQALSNPGSNMDLVLRENDNLIIPEYNNTVKISGNVLYPNTVTYSANSRVKDYIAQAGGYGFKSKRSKAYIIYMNGTVAKARRFSNSAVQPGSEIVVPQKRDKDMDIQNILSLATTSTSVASMLATLGNLVVNTAKP